MLFAFLINFTLFTLATKCLKRILHNMLIICMCLNNSLVSLTSMVSLLILLKEDMGSSKSYCITIASIMSYSLGLSYALVFLICMERYLTIKTFNFGTRVTLMLERQKHRILLVTHVLFLVVSFAVNISLPAASSIPACSPILLYGDLYPVYMGVLWAPITMLLLIVILLYIHNCYVLWDRFLRKSKENQIIPLENLRMPNHLPHNKIIGRELDVLSIESNPRTGTSCFLDRCGDEEMPVKPNPEPLASCSNDQCDNHVKSSESCLEPCTSYSVERWDDDDLSPEPNAEPFASCSLEWCNDDQTAQETDETLNSNQQKRFSSPVDSNALASTSPNIKFGDKPNVQDPVMLKYKNGGINQTRKNVRQNTWERRAFVMNLVVTGTTICLTLPFVTSLWIELVDSTIVSMATLSTLSLLSCMNCFSDPLIYIYSVPEIRKRFTEFFRDFKQNA